MYKICANKNGGRISENILDGVCAMTLDVATNVRRTEAKHERIGSRSPAITDQGRANLETHGIA